jgi:ankyrin repeat protein
MNTDIYYKSLLKRVELLEAKLNIHRHVVFETSVDTSVDGATKLYEDSDWIVYRITTPEAARAIGKRASWNFTAGNRSGQIFNDTIRNLNLDGGFYFYISKNNPKEQYCVLQTKDRKIKYIYDIKGDTIDFLDIDLPVVPEVNLNGITDDDRLIKAVMNNDVAAAKELLRSGADPNAVLRTGHPLICVAAGDLNYPMVRLLLKAGADPNAYNKVHGSSPIDEVLHSMKKWNPSTVTPEKNSIIKELLNYGANVNKNTLEKLCSDGNIQIVKLVLDNLDLDEKSKARLLWRAAEFTTKGNLDVLEYLLDLGIDPNTPNSYGETLLQKMSKWDQRQPLVAKYVNLLKKHGAK